MPVRLLDTCSVVGAPTRVSVRRSTSRSQVRSRLPCAKSTGETIAEQLLRLELLGLALGVERVRHQEEAVDADPGSGEVGGDLPAEALAARGTGGRVRRSGRGPGCRSRRAWCAAAPGSGPAVWFLGLGEGEVEAQRQVAALGELTVQVLDHRVVHVVGRAVGDHDAHPGPVGHQRGTPSTPETASSP